MAGAQRRYSILLNHYRLIAERLAPHLGDIRSGKQMCQHFSLPANEGRFANTFALTPSEASLLIRIRGKQIH
jgi:hypothetical protein